MSFQTARCEWYHYTYIPSERLISLSYHLIYLENLYNFPAVTMRVLC
jgi:hypothetical protein